MKEKLKRIDSLFTDGRFDSYFARRLGKMTRLEHIAALWEKYADNVRSGNAPDFQVLYSHTPFCVSRCSFCVYDSAANKSQAALADHLSQMYHEIGTLAPNAESLTFDGLFIGGGTPGLYQDRKFALLFQMLDESFRLRENTVRSVEMTPLTMTPGKAAIMARHGVNRVSLGVQTTTEKVLRAVNRAYQNMEQIRSAISAIRDAGIRETSTDLIAGLPGETEASFRDSLDRVSDYAPDTIVLYRFFKPPEIAETLAPSELHDLCSWQDITGIFFEHMAANGYAHHDRRYDFVAAYRDPDISQWMAVNDLQSEISNTLLGLGAQAFTSLFGIGHYFNHGRRDNSGSGMRDAYQFLETDLPTEAGICIRRFIEFDRPMPRGDFARYFNSDPLDMFPAEFEYLHEAGAVNVENHTLTWRFESKARAARLSALFLPLALLQSLEA